MTRNIITRTFQLIIFAIIGIIGFLLLNLLLIENWIIPDPCYYHSHDTTKLFDIFYEIKSSEGGHPVPSTFNIVLTIVLGIIAGTLLGLRIINKANKNE